MKTTRRRMRVLVGQKDVGLMASGKEIEEREAAAVVAAASYCAQHPRSPAAVRRPKIMVRGRSFVALLGATLEDGIAGIGGTVEAALRAFDIQYLNRGRPPRR